MKSMFGLMLIASGLGVVCLADHLSPDHFWTDHRSDDWPVREQAATQQTLSITGASMRLLVENVEGYVHVTTGSSSQVQLKVRKMIRADTDTDLKQARDEVKLAVSQQPGSVAVSYDAPWICRNGNGDCHDQHRRFYRVTYDLDLEVPRDVRPFVSTVNGGDVRLNGTTGNFEIKNVNGAITMTGVSGSGKVHTVNGPISAQFTKSPAEATSFSTINGQVDAYFPSSLSADLRFKTMNGEIFTDFDVSPLLLPAPNGERQGAKFVYRSNQPKAARVGHGGPEITFNTLNGNIRLHRNGQTVASNGDSNND